jgi:PAS domain S-box-containing protein
MSVRRFLTIALTAAGVLPLLLLGLTFWFVLHRHIEADIRDFSQSMLKTLSAQAGSSLLDGTRRDLPSLLLLAESHPVAAAESPAIVAEIEGAMLKAFKRPHAEYAFLAVLDSMGRVEASTVPGSGAAYGLHAALEPGSVSFSDPFPSDIAGAVVVEAAYSNGHRTVLALLDLGEISSKLVLVAQSPSDRLGVVDGAGRYLACSDPSRAQARERVDPSCLVPGPTKVESGGSEYYASSKSVPGTHWRILYLRDAALADAPLDAFLRNILALAAAALVCMALISALVWRNITAPFDALVRRIDRIALGRYSERVEGELSAEFKEIGDAFNAMADSIERRDKALLDSEERYRLLFVHNRVPTLIVDPGLLSICDANDAALSYYGYGKEEILSLRLEDLSDAVQAADLRLAASGGRDRCLSRHRLRSGELRDVELYASLIESGGNRRLYCVVFDVTERRLAEERTARALEERTILLREVYHRVKNNLQIISSLLNLQAEGGEDESTMRAFRIAQDRVFAMSLAHELVYQMPDLSSIEAAEYAERLVANLQVAYGVKEGALQVRLEALKLDLERAVPFGLVINELVSNAIKYAKPSVEGPIRVRLELRAGEAGSLAFLAVEDSGPGIPLEILRTGGKGGSLGLSLVNALARQLGGSASWGSGPDGRGALVEIGFPVADPSRNEERGGGPGL